MPLVASIALEADSGSVYVTKPKPRDRPVYDKRISILSEIKECKGCPTYPMILDNGHLVQGTVFAIDIFEVTFASAKTQPENTNNIGRLDITLKIDEWVFLVKQSKIKKLA